VIAGFVDFAQRFAGVRFEPFDDELRIAKRQCAAFNGVGVVGQFDPDGFERIRQHPPGREFGAEAFAPRIDFRQPSRGTRCEWGEVEERFGKRHGDILTWKEFLKPGGGIGEERMIGLEFQRVLRSGVFDDF
jgi:hypothetical protein